MTNNNTASEQQRLSANGAKFLATSAKLWFALAVFGQLIFAYHIISFYGGSVTTGNYEAWNNILPNGYISGDPVGNAFLILHLVLAAIITLGGPLQIIPSLRKWAPAFHRCNGRLYIATALLISSAGLYLKFSRELFGSDVLNAGFTVNALLIFVFAIVTWRHARRGSHAMHRRWALRLFLMVSGTWFFRVGLMAWIAINQGPVGFDPERFSGPFISFWGFAHFLLPLLMLEIYLRITPATPTNTKHAFSVALVLLTLVMLIGIGMASIVFWLP